MMRKFLSVLLVATIAVTSLDMTAYAVEMEKDEVVQTQSAEEEMDYDTEHTEQEKALNETDIDEDAEPTEDAVTTEKVVPIEETQKEVFSESSKAKNDNQVSTELPEDFVQTEQNEDNVNKNNNGTTVEDIQEQTFETENEIKSSDEVETAEEIQTEDIVVGSSAGLNEAMKNKILTLKNKEGFKNGTNWDPNNKGWNNGKAYQCLGFVITLEGQLFKDYPVNKPNTGLRQAPNGQVEEGWTCYHVTSSNYNSLVVEPGDVIDSGTHTAMVLSVNNGQIICVQANLNGNNLVYWGDEYNDYRRFFNYNTLNSTLKGIYDRRNGKTIRLWKASEALRKQATGYSETPAASTLKISGQSSPGNLQVGSRWTCTGTITSNYTINEVSGYILASNNSTVLYSKTINPNATSYSLANGAIDTALLFNKLSAGTYYYKITAKDSSGKSLTLINASFTVTAPAPVSCSFSGKITSPVNGSTIETSKISVQATATDTYAINSFKISLVAGTYNKTVTANATKSGNSYVCSCDMDLPSYTTYTVTVDAVCANGATHRVGANMVTYKKKECSFAGQITSPTYGAVISKPTVNIQARVTDTYVINNFIIKLIWNGQEKMETAPASISGNLYVCNYNVNLPVEARYGVEVYAVCANGATHKIAGDMVFAYDSTPPVISNLKAYKDNGDFFCSADVTDSVTNIVKSWVIVKDERGKEKRFECTSNSFLCVWSNISELWPFGKYTITFYSQDQAGNIGYQILQNVMITEVAFDVKEVSLSVGEEQNVNIVFNTLLEVEGKQFLETGGIIQVTGEETQVSLKALKPGSTKFGIEWIGKNNAFAVGQSYWTYVHVVPQTPKITKISDAIKGYDIITYEPVAYAKTYELYRKRVGIDADYEIYESFADNKSHMITVEHTDKSAAYWYRLRVKAEETTDLQTNEKYYPTSAFSDDAYSERQEENNESEESSESEESPTDDKDITDGLYISGLETKTYTGSAIRQDIKVYYNKILLKEGTDYTLSYKNNINVGNAVLNIKAKGSLTGTVTKNFEIIPREITDTDVIIEDAVYIYDKKAHKKAPKVTYKGKTLKEKKDFEVSSYDGGDYTAIGTYTATIKGIGNFKGTFKNAKIIIVDKNKNISKATIAKIPTQEYQNGAKVELSDELIKVTLAKTELKKGVDYTVSYANNIYQGKATLIIKGKGEYVGTKKVNFMIKSLPTELTEDMIVNKGSIKFVQIKKNGVMPKPQLVSNNNTLVQGKDYVLSYKNNKKTGIGIVIIKGKGSYTGSLEIPFQITSKALTSSDITIRVPNVPYTGKLNKYQSIPVITDSDGGVLVKDKDYTIEAYQIGETVLDKGSNPEEGTEITITIKGKGSYTGTVKSAYTLEGISLAKAVIKVAPKSYTGKLVTIGTADIVSATIKTGKTKNSLKFGKDYEIVSYSNNLKKGTATVTFRGIGTYAGEKTVKFKIMPTTISSKNERAVDMHIDLAGEP